MSLYESGYRDAFDGGRGPAWYVGERPDYDRGWNDGARDRWRECECCGAPAFACECKGPR